MTSLDQWGAPHSAEEEAEESYFVSMTDIMVGLLFIFIIMLMAFALMLKDAEEELKREEQQTQRTREEILDTVQAVRNEVRQMRDLEQQRSQMLQDIKQRLAEKGINVTIHVATGVLRLPDELLFDSDEDSLNAAGQQAVAHLAAALDSVLPCYARVPPDLRGTAGCPDGHDRQFRLEAVFVEGHTDSEGSQAYNWDLSARRAINTFRALDEESEVATGLQNDSGQYLFSVAGYGENRPAVAERSEADMRRNRRIDLRFVMNLSYEAALQRVEQRLNSVLQQR